MDVASVSGVTGIDDILARHSVVAPDSSALIVDGVTHTFGELSRAADELATKLEPNTRVLARLGNSAASLVAAHAAWRVGCSVVTASPMVTALFR